MIVIERTTPLNSRDRWIDHDAHTHTHPKVESIVHSDVSSGGNNSRAIYIHTHTPISIVSAERTNERTMLASRVSSLVVGRPPSIRRWLPIQPPASCFLRQPACYLSSKRGSNPGSKRGSNPGSNPANSNSNSNSKKKSFAPSRRPDKAYQSRHQPKPLKRVKAPAGPREPNDISRPIPKLDFSNISITDVDDDDDDDDDLSDFGPLLAAIQKARHDATAGNRSTDLDVETQLKMMDYFVSAPGSTEDLVGERRALALESWDGQDRETFQAEIDRLVHQERIDYLGLPETEVPTTAEMEAAETGGISRVPFNQLAHGAWYVVVLFHFFIYLIFHYDRMHLLTLIFIIFTQGRAVDSDGPRLQNVEGRSH